MCQLAGGNRARKTRNVTAVQAGGGAWLPPPHFDIFCKLPAQKYPACRDFLCWHTHSTFRVRTSSPELAEGHEKCIQNEVSGMPCSPATKKRP